MDNLLIYCGLHKGKGLRKILKHNKNIKQTIAFEPQPLLYKEALTTLSDLNIEIINAALGQKAEQNYLYIFNRSASSSLSNLSKEWKEHWKRVRGQQVELADKYLVQVINLHEFLIERKIDEVDYLKTDLQGYDLSVLMTLEPLLKERKIKKITCETERNDLEPSAYPDAPPNKQHLFISYLNSFGYKQIDGPSSSWTDINVTHMDLTWQA